MNLSEQSDIFAGQVRAFQAFYPKAHAALIEWGIWSRDRAGIFPCLTQNSMWEQFVHDGTEAHGDIKDAARIVDSERKAERDEERAPDEKLAVTVDEFIHRHIPWPRRRSLLVVYVLTVPEYQYPAIASPRGLRLSPEGFLQVFSGAMQSVEEGVG